MLVSFTVMARTGIRAAGVAAMLAVASPALGRAGGIRSFTDSRGVVHLYNVSRRHPGRRGAPLQLPAALLDPVIAKYADQYNIPRALVKAVVAVESNYNPLAVSARGAVGLMQLMPETAREMYVGDVYDPVQNIQGGVRYLRVLVNRFGGDLIKVLAAYNAGPDQVVRSVSAGGSGVPAIQETQEYVLRVIQTFRTLSSQTGG